MGEQGSTRSVTNCQTLNEAVNFLLGDRYYGHYYGMRDAATHDDLQRKTAISNLGINSGVLFGANTLGQSLELSKMREVANILRSRAILEIAQRMEALLLLRGHADVVFKECIQHFFESYAQEPNPKFMALLLKHCIMQLDNELFPDPLPGTRAAMPDLNAKIQRDLVERELSQQWQAISGTRKRVNINNAVMGFEHALFSRLRALAKLETPFKTEPRGPHR